MLIGLLLMAGASAAERDVCRVGCTYDSIPAALEAGSNGDRILLGDGSWREAFVVTYKVDIVPMPGAVPEISNDPTVAIGSDSAVITVEGPQAVLRIEDISITTINARPLLVHDGGVVDLSGVYLRGFGSVPDGGGAYLDNGSLFAFETVFDGNVAGSRGGHIFATDNSLVSLDDFTVLVDGRAGTDGGAVYLEGPETIMFLANAAFDGNRAFGRGGAVHADIGAQISALSGSFSNNTAAEGGAVALYGDIGDPAVATFTTLRFSDNTATARGGAIWASLAELEIADSTLKDNSAADGGAIMTEAAAQIDVHGTLFCRNIASPGRGGAVFYRELFPVGATPVAWANNRFISNSSVGVGGAVVLDRRPVIFRNSSWLGNSSGIGTGSAVHVYDADLLFSDNLVAFHRGMAISAEHVATSAPSLTLSYNAWWDNEAEHLGPEGVGAVRGQDPGLFSWVDDDNCANDDERFSWSSPLHDAGTPTGTDIDGSRQDIGYLGGETSSLSIWGDNDADGVLFPYDCGPNDALIGPHVDEIWYDGVDQNCDRRSDFDQDQDGFEAIEYGGLDCRDLDPASYPGAHDIGGDDIDQDCDGIASNDGDGDGFSASEDCNDADPNIFPGAAEAPSDTADSNCDGFKDPADLLVPERNCSVAALSASWVTLLLLPLVRRRHA